MTKARDKVKKTFENKRFVRFSEGAEIYSLGITKFRELAREAKATYKVDKVVLVDCAVFENFLESFKE